MASSASRQPDSDDLITVATAAEMLGNSVAYVLERIRAGTFTGEQFGSELLVHSAEVERFRESRDRQVAAVAEMTRICENAGWDYGAEEYGPPRT